MNDKYQDIHVYNCKSHSYIHLIREVHIIQISLGDSEIKIYYRPYKSDEEKYILFKKRYNTLIID